MRYESLIDDEAGVFLLWSWGDMEGMMGWMVKDGFGQVSPCLPNCVRQTVFIFILDEE